MNLVAKLNELADEALRDWKPRCLAGKAARDNCRAAWSNAILAVSCETFNAARRHLEAALTIADAEGGGWEEREAMRQLALRSELVSGVGWPA